MSDDRERNSQAFWTVAIAIPVLLSVLRLWVEAGGELQTTLLLVEHIDPINLIAALVVTASWLASALFVAALAIGGVLNASGPAGQNTRLAKFIDSAPPWAKIGSFALAAATWQIIYLPMLILAACAAFQLSPWSGRTFRGILISVAALSAYFLVIAQTLMDATRLQSPQARAMTVLLLAGPPILSLFIAGPLRPWLIRPWSALVHVGAVLLLAWAALPLVTTPVLPLTVTAIRGELLDEPATNLRGHIITTDDVHTVILGEDGTVNYIRNERIMGQHLCPSDEEIPRYQLRVRLPNIEPVNVEQSLLRALGRANRSATTINPACWVPAD